MFFELLFNISYSYFDQIILVFSDLCCSLLYDILLDFKNNLFNFYVQLRLNLVSYNYWDVYVSFFFKTCSNRSRFISLDIIFNKSGNIYPYLIKTQYLTPNKSFFVFKNQTLDKTLSVFLSQKILSKNSRKFRGPAVKKILLKRSIDLFIIYELLEENLD